MKIIKNKNITSKGLYLLYANSSSRKSTASEIASKCKHVFLYTADINEIRVVSYLSKYLNGKLIYHSGLSSPFEDVPILSKFMDTKFEIFELSEDEILNYLAEVI